MAKKISQLTQATEVKSDDVTVIVQDGETKKLPLNMMVTKQDIENKKVTGLAKLDEIEATYENDTYTPTITVKNKSSVKVGEGDGVDYSANVMDGPAKSAILKGQTLVNLIPEGKQSSFHLNNTHGGAQAFWDSPNVNMIKPSTKYLILTNVTLNTGSRIVINNNEGYISCFTDGIYYEPNEVGIKKTILTSKSDLSDCATILRSYTVTAGEVKGTIQVFEYQDGMENWNIPYFIGMQSVKLPVLTTVGKNLINGIGDYISLTGPDGASNASVCVSDGTRKRYSYITKCKPNTTYTLTTSGTSNRCSIGECNEYPIIGSSIVTKRGDLTSSGTVTITTSSTTNYLISYCYYSEKILSEEDMQTVINGLKVQIEEGSIATSYEPYKSNILTVDEPVELRGIGDVRDELDLLTGELIQNIGEVVLDGNGFYVESQDDLTFTFAKDGNPVILQANKFLSNRFSNVIYVNGTIRVIVNKSEFKSIDDFKENLLTNNLIILFAKSQKSIKTVDLMPSGTHPSTTPYCWKNGHIQLSSSGLLPNLEYSVVTSRAGQINQNATMVVKNDKRIFDLEILLAGGLVNTTYQALTLQNQVETGLSKVSLNSETEPDYLLYHMIMKLIEEKAYKLDDLTEKVSVFYLYEKLSDEQFETIYSALYPFVEDEIVEEPVVEELPEVVEDEVIM